MSIFAKKGDFQGFRLARALTGRIADKPVKPNVGHKPEQILEKLGNISKIYYHVAVGLDLNTFAEMEVWWRHKLQMWVLFFNLGK